MEMIISFHNLLLLLGVLAIILLHFVPVHESYDFSTEHGLSIIDPNDLPNNDDSIPHGLSRKSFPPDFIFGFGSASYQIEGAWNVDDKGPSEWDNFTHTYPDRIADRTNADNATYSYYLYKEDIQQLEFMNADAYRISISWSRVLPDGRIYGGLGINHKGVEYYNNLIDEMIARGVEPCVTMYHFDLPQALHDEYGGLLNETEFRKDFTEYADFLFYTFGDRVKKWATTNEASTTVIASYDSGIFPPNRCSSWVNENCTAGDSATEPYIAAHNLILAHADVVQLYRLRYQKHQKGIIGIVLPILWPEPYDETNPDDHKATRRYLDYSFGWFMSPINYGHYPQSMRDYVGERLPRFRPEEYSLVRGSFDFVGLNYYTAYYVKDIDIPSSNQSYTNDIRVETNYTNVKGHQIGEKLGISWQYSYPKGIWKFLCYVKHHYNNPIIYITENGASEVNKPDIRFKEALKDDFRIKYHFLHLAYIKKAIDRNLVRVKGYYAWALTDNFEWLEGHTIRFGVVYMDYDTYARYPKLSAIWFKKFLRN